MRWRIDGCIGKVSVAAGDTHCGSKDSLLGRRLPPIGLAVKTMENSCRTSPLLVYRTAAHQTWMDEDRIAEVLKSERMGHEVPGMLADLGARSAPKLLPKTDT